MEKRKINFLLYGEGSFLNKGCEAIVNTTIKKIREISDGEIVLSTNDINDKNSYSDVITKYVNGYYKENELTQEEKEKIQYFKTIPFDYTNFEKIYQKDCLKEIENADICMSIGGDNYCYGEPNWLYTINKEIKKQNKRNVFWCTSLFEEIESDEMIRDLKTYDIVVTRETLTYNALKKYLDEENLMLVPDTAFTLDIKEVSLPNIFKTGKKVVGINISPLIMKYTENENIVFDSVKKIIDYILTKTDYNIALIPHVYIEGNNDLDSLKYVKSLYENEKRIDILDEKLYNCEELKYIISKCSYLIAARTHASIAGYSEIVPTLVIGYSVKSKGIALDLFNDYENYVIPVDKIDSETLIDKFKFIVENESKIKEILKEKVPQYQEASNNALTKILERFEYFDKKYVTHRSKCTGCMACVNCCPTSAIEVVESKEGFLYTKINEEKCIKCGLCKKICPINKKYNEQYKNVEFYAAFNKNEEDRIKSSSGGIMSLLAKNILQKQGIVYGVTLEDKKVKHISIDDIKDLPKIMGSKYVQSEIGDTYRKLKDDLEQNKQVLFTGTPCQIEGLKSYLNKEYDNLLCVSIICHGVPSPKIFEKYINEKEINEKKKIENINFRYKKDGWHDFSVVYEYKNDKNIIPFTSDIYMNAFLSNLILRESCYNCQMRYENKNTADIIIGDYWGIENIFPEMDDNKGISAIIINSEKGQELFEEIKNDLNYKITNLQDIIKANPCLMKSTKYTKKRDEFFKMIENNEIITTIEALKYREEIEKTHFLQENLSSLNDEVKILNEQVNDLLEAKNYFLGQIELRDKKITELFNQKESINNELKKVYDSKRWKYANKLANTLKKFKG